MTTPIDTDKPRYQFFTKWIQDISSTTLEENIDTMRDNIQKGLNLIEISKIKNNNSLINSIIDKNITIGNTIDQISQTLYCVQYLKNMAITYYQLIEKYNILTQKFITLNKAITDKLVDRLVDENIKSCYIDYISNIKSISDDLVWWYKQLTKTKWYIDEMIEQDYDTQYCKDIKDRHNHLYQLLIELSWHIQTIDLVIDRVSSDRYEDNRSLCDFGTIVGMTDIESKVYKINNTIKWTTWDNTIDDVKNYEQYVEKVKDKTEQYLDKLNQLFNK